MHHRVRRTRKTLVLFAPDFSETSTVRRAESFQRHGYDLIVFGFRRGRYNRAFEPSWPHVVLGRTWDARYLHRAQAMVSAFLRLFRHREYLQRADIVYARNLDQLLLAIAARALFRRSATLVYEVLDVQPVMVGSGPFSRFLRFVERLCLRQVRLLVLSSAGFHRNYFAPVQSYAGPWFLLENKLPPSMPGGRELGLPSSPKKGSPRRWVVGYFGLIRGQRTFDLIVRLAERLRDKVEFRFRGIVTTVDRSSFDRAISRCDNISYGGEYANPGDLAQIYGEVDLAWALDLENAEHNSRWLMPCRFYEAGYHGVPCLAGAGFEVGRIVEELEAGWAIAEPHEAALVQFFETLSEEAYRHRRERLLALPESRFVSGADAAQLCRLMDEAADAMDEFGSTKATGTA